MDKLFKNSLKVKNKKDIKRVKMLRVSLINRAISEKKMLLKLNSKSEER